MHAAGIHESSLPIRSKIRYSVAVLSVVACSLANLAPASGTEPEVVWSLGNSDGSPIEFAPGSRDKLTFHVGNDVLSKDFAGHQQGSQGHSPDSDGEKPYTIHFDIEQPATGAYHLVLDLIYQTGAPDGILVQVNEKRGTFPVRPARKKDIDTADGNFILLTKQQLIVPIDGSWLKGEGNQITLIPLGIGSMHYDALSLLRGTPPDDASLTTPRLEPTLFYTKNEGQLKASCRLLVPFSSPIQSGTASIELQGQTHRTTLEAGDFDFGVLSQPLSLPALEQPAEAQISVTLDGKTSSASHEFVPAKRWKVFLCPKVHNDIGYTDLQPHVNELDTRNTDTILSILAKFPFYKFNFEASWLVENYLDCRSEEYHRELFDRSVEGRAAINAFYLNLLTGVCTGEELYRSMSFTHELHRKHGVPFDFACLTDTPSQSWFLPTLLSDVGIKAFSVGSNQGRAPILVLSNLSEESPFYWEGINGERTMMWYARVYAHWKMLTAEEYMFSPSSYDYLKVSLPQYMTRHLRSDYLPDCVMVYGAYIDNAAIPETGQAEYIERWNREHAFPQIIVATDADYFRYVEQHYGDKLNVYRGDAGAYWEDGVGSSAEATAWNRQTQQVLPVAETCSSFATLLEPRFRYPAEDFRAAWNNVLFYDEHTWGAYNSVSQPDREGVRRQWEVKESYARRANLDGRNLLARSLNRLCQQFSIDGNTIFAFNFQNRVRSEPLETELNEGRYLVDLSNDKKVDVEILSQQEGWQRVRFLAEDIPPMGYKGYAVRLLYPPWGVPPEGTEIATEPEPAADQSQPLGWTIENEHYQLTVDEKTGGIRSLIDKSEQRELADPQAEATLNEYLYVSGGKDSLILNLTFGSAPTELTIHHPTTAKVVENVTSPLGQRLVVETSSEKTPTVRSEYHLYNKLKRVDIVNNITKEETRDKEAVYFAFPFASAQPEIEYQMQNGWIRPNDDQLPGACREWFTPQNLVHVSDQDFSIAWATRDAPLVTFTDINRGKWPTHLEIANGHLYSYVMNNYWFTNYRGSQGGDFQFRYAITSGKGLSREQLANFDADTRTPVIVYPYLSSFSASVAQKERRFAPGSGSLLGLDEANLQMVVIKQAEDLDGYVIRLLETAGRSGEAVLQSPVLPIRDAHLCNGVEVNQRQLDSTAQSVTIPYKPNRYITVRLRFDPLAP